MKSISRSSVVLAALAAVATGALAHISLKERRTEAGRPYDAVLRIMHGCGGSATTEVCVQVPKGFDGAKAVPMPGWNAAVQEGAATWTAASTEGALPDGQRGEFILAGTAPAAAGPLWFKVLQTCQQGSRDWSQAPAEGTSINGLKLPAVLLQVDPAGTASHDRGAAAAMDGHKP